MSIAATDELFDYYEVTFDSMFSRVCYYFKLEEEEEWTYYYGRKQEKHVLPYGFGVFRI